MTLPLGVTVETSDSYKGRLRIRDSISCAPTTPTSCNSSTAPAGAAMRWPPLLSLTAALIGTALALEVQAIASPAARLRKKSVLRMNVSPEVPVGNERRFPSVPRVQRGARLIRWVSHGEHIQLHPILSQSWGGDHPW